MGYAKSHSTRKANYQRIKFFCFFLFTKRRIFLPIYSPESDQTRLIPHISATPDRTMPVRLAR